MTEFISIEKVLTVVSACFFGFLAWFGKENVKKINYLAKECITRSEHGEDIKLLRKEIADGRKESKEGMRRIYDKLDALK